MGAGAPLGANANNEPVLSIRVACEGADCNALLEVNSNLFQLSNQRKRGLAVLAWPLRTFLRSRLLGSSERAAILPRIETLF